MASNKAATATFIAALAMIFAVEVSVAQETIGNSDDAVRHYKVNGFDFKMEKGNEACYIACYNNVFATNSSPFTAEKRCHKKCSSSAGGSLVSASSAVAAAKHTLTPNRGIFYTGAKKPRVSSAGTGAAAAEKPAVSSAAEKPAFPSAGTGAAAEKPAISSAGTAAEAPVVSSAGAAAEAPVVSSAGAAAEGPAVWSAGTEETNFGNPYS